MASLHARELLTSGARTGGMVVTQNIQEVSDIQSCDEGDMRDYEQQSGPERNEIGRL